MKIIYIPGSGFTRKKVNTISFLSTGTQSLVQNLMAYSGLGHSGPLDLDGRGSGGGSSGGEFSFIRKKSQYFLSFNRYAVISTKPTGLSRPWSFRTFGFRWGRFWRRFFGR